jgi:predicted NBD/HSP70 family sugar kinase
MFTLGNGVGGGIVLNSEIFEGGIMGGSEVGHMSVQAGGRLCSCGRKGCLESYVSIPALKKAVFEASGKEMEIEEIFANRKDPVIADVLKEYTQMLGCGIVNIVNLFRPQMILLGGMMSEYAEYLIDDLQQIMKTECFGGMHGMIPLIRTAKLGRQAAVIGASLL